MSSVTDRAFDRFYAVGGAERATTTPVLVRSPGRINILGEHTDYNDGLCLPAAIDRGTTLVVAKTSLDDPVLRIASDGHGVATIAFGEPIGADLPGWARLAAAVAQELAALGRPPVGLVAGIAGDLPESSGLSSSASFEVGVALALAHTSGWRVDRRDLALACQRAEAIGLGVPCGPLDQLAVAFGAAGYALRLDCHDLSIETVEMPDELAFAVIDSGITRNLADVGYHTRVDECRQAARALGVRTLREVEFGDLDRAAARLEGRLFRRVRHVVTENERVRDAAGADPARLGRLITMSHDSLRDDFAVSTPEIDTLVDIATTTDGVVGARIVGAGFGGSVLVALWQHRAYDAANEIAERYFAEFGSGGDGLIVSLAAGARTVTPNRG